MEWISVKEKLPPIGQKFDVWINGERFPNHGAYVGHWDDDFRRECMLIKGKTHWMPLPKQP